MRHRRRGFSVVEVGLATVIVGGLLVASLTAVAGLSTSRRRAEMADRAAALSNALLQEALCLPYSASSSGLLGSGPSGAESSAGNRSLYNEIGDYNGLSELPIRARDGTAVPNCPGWRRQVSVQFLDSSNPRNTTLLDSGIARVTVTVYGPGGTGTPLARAIGIRTLGWDVANKRNPAAQSGLLGVVVSVDLLGADN